MARTALAVQDTSRSGLTPAYTAANVDGHAVANTGREMLHVKTAGTGCTVTLVTPGTVDGQAIADRAIVIGTSAERMIGPFPTGVYNQPGTPDLWVDFSAVTSVTIAAVRVP